MFLFFQRCFYNSYCVFSVFRTHKCTPTVTVIYFVVALSSNLDVHPLSSFLLTAAFSWEFILYSIQSGIFPPCYVNGRELSMFNEWLEAGYGFRNIPVTMNKRSSSIICPHITVFHRSSDKCAHIEAQIYFGHVSAHLHTVCIVQMLVSLNE